MGKRDVSRELWQVDAIMQARCAKIAEIATDAGWPLTAEQVLVVKKATCREFTDRQEAGGTQVILLADHVAPDVAGRIGAA